jgi:hypothetical protein
VRTEFIVISRLEKHAVFRSLSSEGEITLKIPINQIEQSINPAWHTIYRSKRAESKAVTSRRFEQKLCWILIALIFSVVVLAFVFLVAASST